MKKVHQRLAKLIAALTATLEEMTDPGALRALREAQADANAGRIYTYEDVFGHPLLREAYRKSR